ncbi:uncharacterized protein LOC119372435 [Rhipicephalus sanguineus]|uniref:Uncharacterized protein n=1 Tax=Rhipicephalus sanguineus TaxID=34632 RepID=A0A9D4T612_RHISA|nr:uncharacterized protein LOC119372435 [Rhipicephalus sanguineus]KAH7976181.1 hypothetical protein HPB52_009491 [Rhipicephalus sanguineus]
MGCANAKAAGIPSSGKTDYPLEVTDSSDGTNFISNQVPKVVINGGDVLDNEHHINGSADDAEDKANGNADIPGTETFLPPPETPQETEFLTPPDPPKDDKDDREAVADRAAETPVEDGNDAIDDGGDDNGNRQPPNDVTTDEPMPDAGDGVVTDDASEVGVVVADDNANDVTPLDDVAHDAVDRMGPDVVSDAPTGNDLPRDLNEDNGIVPKDIFVDDGLDYDSKKADRQSNAGHDLIVQDA